MRITIHEDANAVGMVLEGRIAGPWLAELGRAWSETGARLGSRKLSLDLHEVTFADVAGKQLLKQIYDQTGADLIAGTIWAQYLADEIRNTHPDADKEETSHAKHA